MNRPSLLLLLAFAASAALASAQVTYTYSVAIPAGSPQGPSTISWTFNVPSILTTGGTIPAASLTSSSITGDLLSSGCTISSVAILDLNPTWEVTTNFSGCIIPHFISNGFTPGTVFTSVGSWNSLNGETHFSISPALSATPVPPTIILTLVGLLSIGLYMGWRKNLRRVS